LAIAISEVDTLIEYPRIKALQPVLTGWPDCYIISRYRDAITMQTIMFKDFFLGFVKIHILYHASKEPIYGVEILEELGRHGYRLSPGTLYPALHRLQADGYLSVEGRVVGGKIRKYYTITERGTAVLDDAREKITELVDEVLLGR